MNKSWQARWESRLTKKRQDANLRFLRSVEKDEGGRIVFQGKEYLNFSSNDYLGLSKDPRLVESGYRLAQAWGSGTCSSRLISGNIQPMEALEKEFAAFLGSESALFFNSGYQANVGVISALADRETVIFSDRLNHASIIDGILLSRAVSERFEHASPDSLVEACEKYREAPHKILVTDAVFSMNGDLAPLADYVEIARRYNLLLIVDEAHSFGIFGKNGQGLASQLGLTPEIDVLIGTLGKALGVSGALAFGSNSLIDYLVNHCRPFIFTTASPAFVIGALMQALEIVRTEGRGQILLQRAQHFIKRLQEIGYSTLNSQSPIIPVLAGSNTQALDWMALLMERGIFAPAIRPPTVPAGTSRIRISLSYLHAAEDLERLFSALSEIKTGVQS